MAGLYLEYQNAAGAPRLPERFSARARSCSATAAAIQTCQCEKIPEEMAKLLVQLRSAAMHQRASMAAASDEGGSSTARTSAKRLFFWRFLPSLVPLAKRIRTTMEM